MSLGLQVLAVALPRPDQVFTSTQVKHNYLLKALFNNKYDHCCAIIKLEKEMTQVSKYWKTQHDYITELHFDFLCYPLFSLALLWGTKY